MQNLNAKNIVTLPQRLSILTPRQICQIDRCLAELEDFGRLTLIKQKGRLRFIEKTESLDAQQPT